MILAPGFLISCKTGICFTSLKMVSVGVGDELFPFLSGDVIFSHREPGAKKIQIHQIEIYKYCGIIVGIEWLQGESGGMPPFPKNLIVDHRD